MLKFNIKNTVKHHKLLLAAMAVLIICAVFVCDTAVFSFNATRQNSLIITNNASDFTVVWDDAFDNNLLSRKINEFTSNKTYGLESVYVIAEDEPQIYSYYYGNDILSAGSYPQDETQIVIGARTKAQGYSVGDTVLTENGSFTVCGIRPMRDYDEILPSALPQGKQITEIHFRFNHILNAGKAAKLGRQLMDIFPGKEVTVPQRENLLDGILYEIRAAIMIAGIACCNLLFAFCYLFRLKRDAYSAFYICGARPIYIGICAVAELIIYILLGGGIGHILFSVLLLRYQASSQDFLWNGFMISYAVSICLCLSASVPALRRTVSKYLLREEDDV